MDILTEVLSKDDLKKYLEEFYNYAKKRLNLSSNPKVFLKEDPRNADDFFGKTGGYDPVNKEIHLYISGRHPKDVIRSFSHELVHHSQNLTGMTEKVNMSRIYEDEDYAQKDQGLRELERDAFERGNMMFRDWTDNQKSMRKKGMINNKPVTEEVPKVVIKKAHKIAKKVAKTGSADEPYAVGMAVAKKAAGLKQEIKMDPTMRKHMQDDSARTAVAAANDKKWSGKDALAMHRRGDIDLQPASNEKPLELDRPVKEAERGPMPTEPPPFSNPQKAKPVTKRRVKVLAKKGMKAAQPAPQQVPVHKMKEQSDVEAVEKLQENKDPKKEETPENTHPHPELFEEKERLLKDRFNKREELIYNELVRKFINK